MARGQRMTEGNVRRKLNAPDLFCDCLPIFSSRRLDLFFFHGSLLFVHCLVSHVAPSGLRTGFITPNVSICVADFSRRVRLQSARKDYRVHSYLDGNFHFALAPIIWGSGSSDNLYYYYLFVIPDMNRSELR